MATSDSFALWTIFLIILFVQIITSVVAVGLGEYYEEREIPDVTTPPSISDYLTLGAVQFFALPFWTFAMPLYMNLFIMLPLRIMAWILVIRMIRGN